MTTRWMKIHGGNIPKKRIVARGVTQYKKAPGAPIDYEAMFQKRISLAKNLRPEGSPDAYGIIRMERKGA